MTTRLLWHPRLPKKDRPAAVQAAKLSGYPEAEDDGEALRLAHGEGDVGVVGIFLAGAGRLKLFSSLEGAP